MAMHLYKLFRFLAITQNQIIMEISDPDMKYVIPIHFGK